METDTMVTTDAAPYRRTRQQAEALRADIIRAMVELHRQGYTATCSADIAPRMLGVQADTITEYLRDLANEGKLYPAGMRGHRRLYSLTPDGHEKTHGVAAPTQQQEAVVTARVNDAVERFREISCDAKETTLADLTPQRREQITEPSGYRWVNDKSLWKNEGTAGSAQPTVSITLSAQQDPALSAINAMIDSVPAQQPIPPAPDLVALRKDLSAKIRGKYDQVDVLKHQIAKLQQGMDEIMCEIEATSAQLRALESNDRARLAELEREAAEIKARLGEE